MPRATCGILRYAALASGKLAQFGLQLDPMCQVAPAHRVAQLHFEPLGRQSRLYWNGSGAQCLAPGRPPPTLSFGRTIWAVVTLARAHMIASSSRSMPSATCGIGNAVRLTRHNQMPDVPLR